jgi:hypothetical protein
MAIQTTGEAVGEATEEKAATDGTDAIAPPVRFEPCTELSLDHDAPWAVCTTCGWLDDDHARADTPSAVVTELPRRGVVLPERQAS